jgi:hypothetical protein
MQIFYDNRGLRKTLDYYCLIRNHKCKDLVMKLEVFYKHSKLEITKIDDNSYSNLLNQLQ